MSSNRERQLAELILLQSMYPSEFTWQTSDNTEPSLSDIEHSDPSVSLQLDPSFTLDLTLPPSYPSSSLPHAYLQCSPPVPTPVRKAARLLLSTALSSLPPGEEALDLLLTALTPGLAALTSSSPSPSAASPPVPTPRPPVVRRQLFWAHHLLATSKRRDIQAWTRELRLCGWARPGYPGAVLVEGGAADVGEFERRIKALRWQALQVRGEEDGERRVLGDGGRGGVIEVEELSDIVRGLREVDGGEELVAWFLGGMRIGHG